MDQPDPAARPARRSFTAEYKHRIVAEYDELPHGSEDRGALLRREGLYTSHISEWRKQRDAAALEGLSPKVRQPKRTAEQVEVEKLRRRNAKLEEELTKTKLALGGLSYFSGGGRSGLTAGGAVRGGGCVVRWWGFVAMWVRRRGRGCR